MLSTKTKIKVNLEVEVEVDLSELEDSSLLEEEKTNYLIQQVTNELSLNKGQLNPKAIILKDAYASNQDYDCYLNEKENEFFLEDFKLIR